SPLQEQKLGTKAGTHGGKQTQSAGFGAAVLHHVLKHTKHGGRREITDFTQAGPRSIELSIVQSQCVGRSVEHFWSAGMEDEAFQVASLVPVVRHKCVHISPKVFANQSWNLGREYDAETLLRNIPAHHFFCGRIKDGASSKNLRSGRGMTILELRTGHNHSRGAIGEKPRGDQVRDRQVLALQGQRTKLNRNQRRSLRRIGADIVSRARYSGG